MVPAPVREDAVRATRLHPAGVGVLDLAYDSLLDAAPGGHAPAGPRRLCFVRSGLRVTVDVVGTVDLALGVRLNPPTAVTVQLLHLAGRGASATATGGGCVLRGVPAGLSSLLLRPLDGAGAPVRTAWVLL